MTQSNMSRVALVTGANRGIGFEIARQLARKGLRVVIGSRDESKGRQAAERLKRDGLEVDVCPLDVSRGESIDRAVRTVLERHGRIDVLVNNAGILLTGKESDDDSSSAFEASLDQVRESMETNVYGPLQLMQKVLPLMRKQGYGRVVNLSSGMGQLSEMNGGYLPYRMSKTALNVLTRVFADEVQGAGVLINSVCPGWVKTDMGGEGAELPVEKGADTPVWLATLPAGGPTGGFFRERERIEW